MALLSESRAAQLSSAARVFGKTYAGTAKATWKVASFFFVLVLPLVVQVEIENQQKAGEEISQEALMGGKAQGGAAAAAADPLAL